MEGVLRGVVEETRFLAKLIWTDVIESDGLQALDNRALLLAHSKGVPPLHRLHLPILYLISRFLRGVHLLLINHVRMHVQRPFHLTLILFYYDLHFTLELGSGGKIRVYHVLYL